MESIKKISVYDKRGKYRNNKTCLVEEMRYRLKKKSNFKIVSDWISILLKHKWQANMFFVYLLFLSLISQSGN